MIDYRSMDFGPKPPVTWEQIVSLARKLETPAFRNDVPPAEGARLVRLVLQFNESVIGGVHSVKPGGPPPDSKTG